MSLRDDAEARVLANVFPGADALVPTLTAIIGETLAEVADWCDRQAQRADVNGWCANTLGEVARACRGEDTANG